MNKIIFIILIIFAVMPCIYSQPSINSKNDDYCLYNDLYVPSPININEQISEENAKLIVTLNLHNISNYTILNLFREEYQIFLFINSTCTKKFLNESEIKKFYFKNKLHLFSINGTEVEDINSIKLVIQTKKKFYIFFYTSGGTRIFHNSELDNKNYTIKTNVFPYFKNKLFYEEYTIFENQSINIFNENEKIFNDICYIYRTRSETKPPELRKHLYYYKYDNDTYPLLESNDNCNLTNTSISYEDESFILKYTCKHNTSLLTNKTQIYNISILSKEDAETYKGPNSLKDQEKILYCNKETYNNNAIRNNVGFYISLFLLLAVFICLIFLIVQKYDLAQKAPLDSPPKKTTSKSSTSVSKKKKVNFSSVEILPNSKEKKINKNKTMIDESDENDNDNGNDDNIKSNTVYKPKKKKKGKKKKKKIDDNNEDNNNDNNNDLEWYSNNLDNMIDDDNNDDNKNNSYPYKNDKIEIRIKKKKKTGKKKKGRRKKTNEDNDEEKAKSDDENEIKGNIKSKISKKINDKNDNNDKIIMNKTISNFPNAYNKLKDNSAIQIKNNLNLRRLVIITNLGKNLEENSFNFNDNELIRQGHNFKENNSNKNNSKNNIIINNNNDKDNISEEIGTNDNLRKTNSLLPMIRDNIVNNGQNERNIKMAKIVGFEDDSFISNIKRDYLIYEDAIFFDNREFCFLLTHFLKLKNDLINIFYCNYSFAPYSIRLIKFLFFFHFMFYLEILCIGQKYYFKKYYSKEYQSFIEKKYNLKDVNITNNLNITNNKNLTFFDLEKYFSIETSEIIRIQYLYTFKYAFARILIPVAISYISYIFTSILSPRRKILRIYLNNELEQKDKIGKYKKISKKYKIIYIIFGTLALLIMVFFFYSITNYFVIFEDAKYDIPQSFLLSGLIRFILDIIIWTILANIRKTSVDSHSYEAYGCIRGICEIN